ncbi:MULTISPECIES: hypothetical protein [unclassified Wolbachia]|nr:MULTISPECIES: hypothetical protein [unclassified Wolbachia]
MNAEQQVSKDKNGDIAEFLSSIMSDINFVKLLNIKEPYAGRENMILFYS